MSRRSKHLNEYDIELRILRASLTVIACLTAALIIVAALYLITDPYQLIWGP